MLAKNGKITEIRGHDPLDLVKKYGSPLYIYDEIKLRERCRQIKNICRLPNFTLYYSTKANSSIALLKIIKSEGIMADAMSLGELYLVQQAGFSNSSILFMSNNIHSDDLERVIQQDIKICLDSLDELELFFDLAPRKAVSIRINNGITDGHSDKVKTGGAVKFGITPEQIPLAFDIAKKSGGRIEGFFSHIGSSFLDHELFHQNVLSMLEIAQNYPELKYLDFGGGFGIPYREDNRTPFPVGDYSKLFSETLDRWQTQNNTTINFSIQPGRFIVAECGICLCRVQSIKTNYGKSFVGTDLGFNFFPRPMIYGAYHRIINVSRAGQSYKKYNVVGNLCESGDVLGKDVQLDRNTVVGDILLLKDTGAYCFSMSSNYVAMPRPAEILLQENGTILLIRKSETIDMLSKNQLYV